MSVYSDQRICRTFVDAEENPVPPDSVVAWIGYNSSDDPRPWVRFTEDMINSLNRWEGALDQGSNDGRFDSLVFIRLEPARYSQDKRIQFSGQLGIVMPNSEMAQNLARTLHDMFKEPYYAQHQCAFLVWTDGRPKDIDAQPLFRAMGRFVKIDMDETKSNPYLTFKLRPHVREAIAKMVTPEFEGFLKTRQKMVGYPYVPPTSGSTGAEITPQPA